MVTLPHDHTDLYLAPTVLAVDAFLEDLGRLESDALAVQLALAGDHPDWTRELREDGLTQAVMHRCATHEWDLSVDQRGLRVSHGSRNVVLGLPANVVAYLAGPAAI